ILIFLPTHTANTEIFTLSLHDALPISANVHFHKREGKVGQENKAMVVGILERGKEVRTQVVQSRKRASLQAIVKEHVLPQSAVRSEEHTSELQSPYDLVCRLLLEKKNV